jgi:RNA polymerase sigma factor (sigma-70 family)
LGKDFYLFIGGERVPVDEETYRAFMRPVWAARRRESRAKERGLSFLSLDAFMESGYDPPDDEARVEGIVEDKLLLEMLSAALRELTEDERVIIDALFYADISEREAARDLGIPRTTLARQRDRILAKLRSFFEKT